MLDKFTSPYIRYFARYIAFSTYLLLSLGINSVSAETLAVTGAELDEIDRLHQTFSSSFHSTLLRESDWGIKKVQSVKSLEHAVSEHIKNGSNILAANLIIKNVPMLKTNYDNLAIFTFIKILLEQNEWNYAKLLFDLIRQEGDRTLISNTEFIFATYTFKRQKWQQTLEHINDSINDLPHEDYHYALLMKGISLQRLSQHREAIPFYQLIPATSKYYISARLNMAIANIRQGWWTDGHTLIEEVLKRPETRKQEESLNRLFLTLGYSFLNQEYYRNSRDSFRNIGLKSNYTNQALLGIALTAASQEDYIGALNAVRILKDKESFDLPVDESYLLTPYFYEKLRQNSTASAGYTEAINYYQTRIIGIQEILKSKIDLARLPIQLGSNTTLTIGKEPINFSEKYPDYIFENYLMLGNYQLYLPPLDNDKLNNEFNNLKAEYEAIIVKIIKGMLNRRIEHLNSYMDQARYGLARLYDNELVKK